ncbi:HNH endonuclease [Rhizobium sp. TH2]|uniref:HNH endonuclease n=1 Tax=Rhizobium sp. TH2 TaxID=2775403 RepID=UPI00215773CE|nr:HNH endonuclease [Rhizobium sp. TH2]UVC10187.1 HNH endonuclease [Rhizobium sp. TH2]
MTRPPRLCICGKIVPHSTLCQCQRVATRARNARHDARRPSPRDRGYDHEWRKARIAYLDLHPHCAMLGCGKPARVVDHRIPHRGDDRLFWDRTNWQSLCTPCHSRVKQRQERVL